MNEIAEKYLCNTLNNVEVQLVSIVVYNETKNIDLTDRNDILKQIDEIIKERYKNFDNTKINIDGNAILKRITYIVMPIWKLDELAQEFQDKI